MTRIRISFWIGIGVMILLHVVGMFGYMWFGGPKVTAMDGLYMTFITVATIGYGEIVDLTNNTPGRIFTMVIGFAGILTMTYLFSAVTAWMVESDLNQRLKRRRMNKGIDRMQGHYIVCGLGRVGANVINELIKTGRTVVVIERDATHMNDYMQRGEAIPHFIGDATDDQLLANAGIARAAGLFAITGEDSVNLLLALAARQMAPKIRIIVRVHEIRNSDKARRCGADDVISPDFTGGMRIASAMVRPTAVSFMDQMLKSSQSLRIEEHAVNESQVGKTIHDIGRRNASQLIMAIRSGADWIFNPEDSLALAAGDVIISMSTPQNIKASNQLE